MSAGKYVPKVIAEIDSFELEPTDKFKDLADWITDRNMQEHVAVEQRIACHYQSRDESAIWLSGPSIDGTVKFDIGMIILFNGKIFDIYQKAQVEEILEKVID